VSDARLLRRTAFAAVLSLAGIGAGGRDSLIDAAKRRDAVTVRALVAARHVDANASEADGTTPLHWAVRASELEIAQLLVRAGANVNLANRYGITPLSLAATNGDASLATMLLKAGADPNARGPAGETILMTAARTGNLGVLNALLAHGADVHATEGSQQQTALMWAAHENQADAVRALIDYGADPDVHSKVLTPPEWKWATTGMVSTTLPRGGWTALMYAARQNALDAAAALAEAGADLNQADPDGSTALLLAIINAHFDLANLLVERGADPNIADETGTAALFAAVDMHTLRPMIARPSPRLTSRMDAVALARSLLARGANPNARLKRVGLGRLHESADPTLGEGSTPLMRAAKSNDVALMRVLLDSGADPTLTQRDFTNALMLEAAGGAQASEYLTEFPVTEAGALEGIKLLLDRGVDVDAFNVNGQTALHMAAGRGANRIVGLLAERGAKLDAKNKQGHTPLEVALGAGRHRPGQDAPVVHETTAALLRQLTNGPAPQVYPEQPRRQ
jgi:ankyrin repeat protein